MAGWTVQPGQSVKRGDVLGPVGSTGNSTGPHVHLNLVIPGGGKGGYVLPDVVDPLPYIDLDGDEEYAWPPQVEVTADGLRLRVSPALGAPALATLKAHDRLELVDDSNPEWVGVKGWLKREYTRRV
jgi:hypothetical protein